jgi:hypothetical protein
MESSPAMPVLARSAFCARGFRAVFDGSLI